MFMKKARGIQRKQSESPIEKYKRPSFFGESRKKHNFLKVLGLCKRRLPLHLEKLLSWIEFETGLSRNNAKSMLMVLLDIEMIKIDEVKKMVFLGEKVDERVAQIPP